jgi:hypothetical protein
MNSNNVLSLSGVLLLAIIVVVTTLGIGGQMVKAGLVIDKSVAGPIVKVASSDDDDTLLLICNKGHAEKEGVANDLD